MPFGVHRWIKDVKQGRMFYSAGALQSNGRLTIPECQRTFQGRYVCTIYVVGGHSKSAYTTLLVSPDIIDRPGKC